MKIGYVYQLPRFIFTHHIHIKTENNSKHTFGVKNATARTCFPGLLRSMGKSSSGCHFAIVANPAGVSNSVKIDWSISCMV